MESKSERRELIGFGSVEMMRPLVLSFSDSPLFSVTEYNVSTTGPTFRRYSIFRRSPEDFRLGLVETYQLPFERVLIAFMPGKTAIWRDIQDYTPELRGWFDEFMFAAVTRLEQLGFIYLPAPEPPKRPYGFAREHEPKDKPG